MKKYLFISAAIVAGLTIFNSKAKAQSTGDATVNIILADAFSIVMNPTSTVNFNYPNAVDYTRAQDVPMAGHFTVVSNKPYSVAVKGSGPFTRTAGGTILLNTVTVNVLPTTTGTGISSFPTVALTTSDQTIAGSATQTTGTSYNINYGIPLANVPNLLNKAAGTYVATVTYTVTQP